MIFVCTTRSSRRRRDRLIFTVLVYTLTTTLLMLVWVAYTLSYTRVPMPPTFMPPPPPPRSPLVNQAPTNEGPAGGISYRADATNPGDSGIRR